MSMVDESNLTDLAQRELSSLRKQLGVQLNIIKGQEAVEREKGDTYVCRRSMTVLDSAANRIIKHNKDYQDRIEYFEDKYKKMIQRLDEELEAKKKETKALFGMYIETCEIEMEKHSKIIDSERNKKSPNVIRAEQAVQRLTEKIDKIRNIGNINDNMPIMVPDTDKPMVDWAEIAKQQLANMKPSEREFYESTKHTLTKPYEEPKEEVYMYKGERVSKFEYDRFTQQDAAEARRKADRPKADIPKKPIKMVQLIKTDQPTSCLL
jgi:hypothetical protein